VSFENDNDESEIERVLRKSGSRPAPPADLLRSVRASVEAEWRKVVNERRIRRRRMLTWSAAAGIVLAVAVAAFVLTPSEGPRQRVAGISVATGSVRAKSGLWSRWRVLHQHSEVDVGEVIATGADGRVALELQDNVSLRLDHATRVSLTDARHVAVVSGTVYVDSGQSVQPFEERLQVVTPAGAIRHVGTQYEVQLVGSGVRIAVREGKVELSMAGGATHHAVAGEQMVVSSGDIEKMPISRVDSTWAWAQQVAPAFDIDGRSVTDFLAWVSRETGREVTFATPQAETQAARVMLSGSIAGLNPQDALAAVLRTTPLRSQEVDGQFVISGTAAP
jgi:ferric-dicitrate binding protein FerR (iron transport regulator)